MNKLVPLVQSLSQHINVFLVEYNKYNNLQLNLPGFRPTSTNNANNLIDADASGMYFYFLPLSDFTLQILKPTRVYVQSETLSELAIYLSAHI